ncbi:MAG: HAD family hydrolase [Candidatus Sumerlaeia bacterium]
MGSSLMPLDKAVRHVFFDAGGTLISPWPSVGAIYADLARRFGRDYDPEDVEARYRRAAHQLRRLTKQSEGPPYGTTHARQYEWWKDLVGLVFPEWAGQSDFDAFFNALFYEMERPARYRLMDGALETIDELKRRGYGAGLISNWDLRLRPVLDGLGLSSRLDPIVISAEVGVEKPSSGIFKAALRQAGVDARQAVYVGDSFEWDVLGARGVGMMPVLINCREPVPSDDSGFITISELADLLTICPPI